MGAAALIGGSFHPGGMRLTERLGVLLGLDAQSRVLDLAAGRGTSALHLAREFGCQVIGVDYSARNVALAQESAVEQGLARRVQFVRADAEQLDAFADASFDAVVCECAFCTFPDKQAAAAEIARVLVPGGRIGLSDLTRSGLLPPELDGLLAWVACIGDALPIDGYVGHFETAGLNVERVEPHDEALAEMVKQIRGRLVGAQLLTRLPRPDLTGVPLELQQAGLLARRAEQAIATGALGYTLIVASRTTTQD
jgi:arsenite methyltransferase